MKGEAQLDLLFNNRENVGNTIISVSFGCSNHKLVEVKNLKGMRKVSSRLHLIQKTYMGVSGAKCKVVHCQSYLRKQNSYPFPQSWLGTGCLGSSSVDNPLGLWERQRAAGPPVGLAAWKASNIQCFMSKSTDRRWKGVIIPFNLACLGPHLGTVSSGLVFPIWGRHCQTGVSPAECHWLKHLPCEGTQRDGAASASKRLRAELLCL